jgi:23S rRNA (guanosine2251-2'-O)-methyltransferase
MTPSTSPSRLIAGFQPVREAIRIHRHKIERLVVDSRATPRLEAMVRFASDQGVQQIERLPKRELDRLTGDTEHQGFVCWAPALALAKLESLLAEPRIIAIALDEIQDPHNFGAVVRCAVAIADAAILWGENSSAPLTPATFRASAGAIEQARLCRVRSLRDALHRFAESGADIVGLDAHAAQPIHRMNFGVRTVMVLGSEHKGLSRGIRSSCTRFARLSSSGKLDSLNASVAAGIALHMIAISSEISIR